MLIQKGFSVFFVSVQKHLALYNLHRTRELAGERELLIAEGFFNAMRVWQAGFRNVVALMGTSLSDEQEQFLIKALVSNGKLTLMLDPDEPGIKATKEIVERLITGLYIKVIDLTYDGVEPDDLSAERIREMFSESRDSNAP